MSNQTINVRSSSGQVLDERMRMIKNSGSVIGLERIAVMAALNLSHELIVAQSAGSSAPVDTSAIERMQAKIEAQLDQLATH